MTQPQRQSMGADPWTMLLSAAIFGFFGFFFRFNYYSGITGKLLLFMPMLVWTLRGSAIAFVACAAVSFRNRRAGGLAFGVAGLLSAVMLLVVAVMDILDRQHTAFAYAEYILPLFAAWNGYGAWLGLREWMREGSDGRGEGPRDRDPLSE